MAYHTPARLNPPRASLGSLPHTVGRGQTKSPSILHQHSSSALTKKGSVSVFKQSTMNRANQRSPTDEISVGDIVDVPGSMHGIVRFIGNVKNKQGIFAGVELSEEFSARGKNDGDVDGIRYFETTIPNSGIFLPLYRATKRESNGPTDRTQTAQKLPNMSIHHSAAHGHTPRNVLNIEKHTTPHYTSTKFSQSVGPIAGRSCSPSIRKFNRPSFSRPESPLRKPSNLGYSVNAGRVPRSQHNDSCVATARGSQAATTVSSNSVLHGQMKNSVRTKFGSSHSAVSSVRSVTHPSINLNGLSHGINDPLDSHHKLTQSKSLAPADVRSLIGNSINSSDISSVSSDNLSHFKQQLAERNQQIIEQSEKISELEASLSKLQTLIYEDDERAFAGQNNVNDDDQITAQLRALIKEKNDRIKMLTAEFDSHRADFRSTIETLELASMETERVYENKVMELSKEVEMLRANDSSAASRERYEELAAVAHQLKQLEELVAELEEGLEDARRGEAGAKSEADFLRQEFERVMAELKREREKNAQLLHTYQNLQDESIIAHRSLSASASNLDMDSRDSRSRKVSLRRLSVGNNRSISESESPKGNVKANQGMINTLQKSLEKLELENTNFQAMASQEGCLHDRDMECEINKLKATAGKRLSIVSSREAVGESCDSRRSSLVSGTNMEEELRASIGQENVISSHDELDGGAKRRIGFPEHNGHADDDDDDGDDRKLSQESTSDTRHSHQSIGQDFDTVSSTLDSTTTMESTWCDICESAGHDILNCPSTMSEIVPNDLTVNTTKHRLSHLSYDEASLNGHIVDGDTGDRKSEVNINMSKSEDGSVKVSRTLDLHDEKPIKGKTASKIYQEEWCALCERDGHNITDCPFEPTILDEIGRTNYTTTQT